MVLAVSTQLHAAPAVTTTGLTVSPGGPISEGTFVSLVATVRTNAPVTQGRVYFCEMITTCLVGEGSYGVAQLTSSGTATLRTRLNVGDNNVLAVFMATKKNLGSKSTASIVTVTSRVVYSSTASLSSSGVPGNYTLTGSVSSFGREQLTGAVSLIDSTANNFEIGSGALSNPSIGLSNAIPYSVGRQPGAVATGDFNGDGTPDLVVADENDNDISVLLGNGDGTFRQQITWPTGHTPESIAVGDFNGDGISDLAVADTNGNCISVFLGNGDGSFQSQLIYGVGRGPVSIATGDFNSDGNADLVVANVTDSDVSILLGNGDGTFQAASVFTTGRSPQSVAVGDFNSDGVIDLAVADTSDDTVSILIGNDDGTFQARTTWATGVGPYSLATADLNNDGILDLAIANRNSNTVSIMIGNGNGTFQNQVPVAVGTAPDAIAVGDFNGDGIPDLAVCNQFDSTVSILLGDGAASFLPRLNYKMGYSNGLSLVVGDFNGDGITDLANTDLQELNVQLGQQIASFSVSGISNLGSGTNWVYAGYPGDNIRFPSQSLTVPLIGIQGTAVVSLFSAPNPASFGTVITLSATVSGGGGVSPTGEVIFKDGATVLGTSRISGATATITAGGLAVGSHSITAFYVGDFSYGPTTSMPFVQTIVKAAAAMSLMSSINPSVYGNMLTITATLAKSATGVVVFMDGENTIGSGVVNGDGAATISTSSLAAGLHTITAVYSGDGNFQ
ncbi:FG-GAP-like repeat-containing protein [Tunturiibacter gelidoferens]|uniref:FG-GAP-like repeat-containing protein n=1 Tax=Tunturiibacter gelidiferens TaxID=3069689 RepID=A0AAU7YZM6_9BACT